MVKSDRKSHENPGWKGKGIPTIKDLAVGRLLSATKLLFQGSFSAAINLAISGFVDLWNFYIHKQSSAVVECPCCGWRGPAFLTSANWRAVTFQSYCPKCDSRSRHRGLVLMLPTWLPMMLQGELLLFAPELILLKQLEKYPYFRVVTTDLNSNDVDFPGEDIQKLSFADRAFAVVVCNHVLEHVPDDEKAILECSRVIRPGGLAIFTVPGDFKNAKTWIFDRPDPNGHLRHYGMDILDKFNPAFEQVEALDMGAAVDAKWGVRRGDYVFVCFKSKLEKAL